MAVEQGAGSTGSPTSPTTNRRTPDPPPQVTMGLLDYITVHSLDDDYAHVSARDGARGEPKPARAGLAALVILGLFGLLVVTAAQQTSRNAVASEDGHNQLVTQVKARSAQVDARRNRVVALRDEVETLRTEFLATTAQGRQLSARMTRLGVRTGASAVTGPGVKVIVDDAVDASSPLQRVLDKDLQRLANALWESGAEALSINGQRLSQLTAIRHAGSAITVNGRSLSAPYTVQAIGDPDTIPARFVETTHGSAWLDLEVTYGLRLDMTSEESLTLPPTGRLILRHARTPGDRG